MKLRYIATWYNRGETPDGGKTPDDYNAFAEVFDWNTRFICNWLCKAVRKLQIETGPVRMLCFTQIPGKSCSVIDKCSQAIHCFITLSAEEQSQLKSMSCHTDRYEFMLSFLERGYREASKTIPLPLDKLFGLHEQFRKGGYKNEWLFKKKMLREYGLYVFLKCYFTTFDFHLELEAYDLKKTRLIAREVIFRSPPDEICFSKDFRSIRVAGEYLEILNFIGVVEMKINLELLTQGVVSVKYIDGDFLSWEEENEMTRQVIERITW